MQGIMLKDYEVSFNGSIFVCVDRGFEPNEEIEVVIRPEDILIVPPAEDKITGEVTDVVFKGVHYEVIVVDDRTESEWMIHTIYHTEVGAKVGLDFEPEAIHIMKKEAPYE